MLTKDLAINPNHILIFCSWLDVRRNIGSFFIEQAELIKPEYVPILVVFKKVSLSKQEILNFSLINLIETKLSSNTIVVEVNYFQSKILPELNNSFFEDLGIKELNKYLRRKNISVKLIHAQSLFDGGIWAYRYYEKYKTPYIITEHNQLTFRNIPPKKSAEAIKSLENAKKILVVSNDKIRQFAANRLFFNFINIGNLVSREFRPINISRDSTKIRLITIGAYTPIKDQITLLRALKIIDDKNIGNIEFTWVGIDGWGGNNEKHVTKLLREYRFKNVFVNDLSNENLDKFINMN